MQSANKIDKFMRLSGAPDSSGLHELLRLLNNVAVKPIGIRDGDEDKGLSLDDEMYDGVGDEDDDEEDGENDEGESQAREPALETQSVSTLCFVLKSCSTAVLINMMPDEFRMVAGLLTNGTDKSTVGRGAKATARLC